ncbi:MAG: LytTR family DNA-binding domain-containing protein [Ignavibacteriaceae bacterium]
MKEFLKRVWTLLNLPYSLTYEVNTVLKEASAVGFFVFLFLYFFEGPDFRENDLAYRTFIEFLSFGFAAFVISFIMMFSLPRVFPGKINEETWTTLKEIGTLIILLVIISIVNSVLFYIYGYSGFNSRLIFESLLETLKIAVFPIIFGIQLEQNRRLNRYLKSANIINQKLDTFPQSKETNFRFILHEENCKNSIEFDIRDVYFIKSAGNYVEIYLKINGIIKPTLLRNSLTKIAIQLRSVDNILKCHRTYLVNTLVISSVEGNSQGYRLKLKDTEYVVPVSRNYTKVLATKINQVQSS